MITMKNVSILIDSFLESGYVFHKGLVFFWEKTRKPRRFFSFFDKDIWQRQTVMLRCR